MYMGWVKNMKTQVHNITKYTENTILTSIDVFVFEDLKPRFKNIYHVKMSSEQHWLAGYLKNTVKVPTFCDRLTEILQINISLWGYEN